MNWLQSILAAAREAYIDAATREAVERPSDRAWEKFSRALEDALTGADFIAVARMRHAPRDPSNPPKWWEPHRELTKPAVIDRARIVTGIERAFYKDHGAMVEHRLDEVLESRFQLLWRLSSAEIAGDAEQVQLSLPGGFERWPFAEYFTMDDARVRPTHALMAGFVAVSWWEGWSRIRPPNGYNSFAPWTPVAGEFVSGSKARYAGPLVQIETRHGSRLSVTPNHPVLTPRGFVPAHELREGDNLFHYDPAVQGFVGGSRKHALATPAMAGDGIDNQHIPPTIEQAFNSLLPQGTASTFARTLPVDFHGDGRFYQGDVSVVSLDGPLPFYLEPTTTQLADKGALLLGTGPAPLVCHTRSALVGAELVRIGASPQLDAGCLQAITDDLARTTELLRQLQNGNAGQVRLDQVVSRNVGSWSGHVYDLQSPNGTIVADGLIVSNCRCRLIFRSMDHALSRKWATRAGPKWETRWPSSGAETNYLYGLFPDQGWQGPKVFAGALDTPSTMGV